MSTLFKQCTINVNNLNLPIRQPKWACLASYIVFTPKL